MSMAQRKLLPLLTKLWVSLGSLPLPAINKSDSERKGFIWFTCLKYSSSPREVEVGTQGRTQGRPMEGAAHRPVPPGCAQAVLLYHPRPPSHE